MNDSNNNTFYDAIEPGVRDLVRCLRERGINTICSCHHEWSIQCESVDPSAELRVIWLVMHDMAVREYHVTLLRQVADGHYTQYITINFSPTMTMVAAVKA